MKIEMWFGSRKNKELIEIEYDSAADAEEVVAFLKQKFGSKFRRIGHPERDHDFKDEKGNRYWFEEMMVQLAGERKYSELIIRNDDKNNPTAYYKKFDGRYKAVNSQPILRDRHVNDSVINAMLNEVIVKEIVTKED